MSLNSPSSENPINKMSLNSTLNLENRLVNDIRKEANRLVDDLKTEKIVR